MLQSFRIHLMLLVRQELHLPSKSQKLPVSQQLVHIALRRYPSRSGWLSGNERLSVDVTLRWPYCSYSSRTSMARTGTCRTHTSARISRKMPSWSRYRGAGEHQIHQAFSRDTPRDLLVVRSFKGPATLTSCCFSSISTSAADYSSCSSSSTLPGAMRESLHLRYGRYSCGSSVDAGQVAASFLSSYPLSLILALY